MFTTTSEYSILECPPIMPYVIEKPTNWKFNTIEVAPNCPRCASSNTKFCYYNNYSFSQPRYFCKSCRRYWTKGGSLRNVPVGGGCRKSRRARSKQNHGSNNEVPDHSPVHVGSTNTPDIDLADVFAKYVNQNVGNEKSSSPGASGESSENVQERSFDLDSQMEGVSMMMEYQNPVGLINGDDQVLPQLHENLNGHDFTMYQNSNEFELQGIIGNSTSEDILWSEDSTNLPNFGAQQSIVQMPDLGLFSPEHDQLRISANMINDNWASFDISGFEIF